jgi:hypothetical protein
MHGINATLPIFMLHSTAMMNFISAYGVFCTYPQLILTSHALSNYTGPAPKEAKVVFEKYDQRGFTIEQSLDSWSDFDGHICMSAHVCPQTIHTLYDSSSLFIQFGDISEHDRSCVIYNMCSTTLWTL